jgi:hypothetical protein
MKGRAKKGPHHRFPTQGGDVGRRFPRIGQADRKEEVRIPHNLPNPAVINEAGKIPDMI